MEIQLNSKTLDGYYAEIDDSDYELVKDYKWRLFKTQTKCRENFYAQTDIKREDGRWTTIYMHRLIMDSPKRPYVVDHIDGNGLNNTRDNLRVVTQLKNMQNNIVSIENGKLYRSDNKRTIATDVDNHIHVNLFKLADSLDISVGQLLRDVLFDYLEENHKWVLENKVE